MRKGVSDSTLQKWWRQAVLAANGHRCAICGKVRRPIDLECHHLIKRRVRITRHDWRNGVPVCVGGCHRYADTAPGTWYIIRQHREYLTALASINIKDRLLSLGISREELQKNELAELKSIVQKYYAG